jgi:drug/metabolite transporter (DMT)-like permease
LFFFWKLEAAALEPANMVIFGIVVLLSIIANLFTFYSMKWEKVSNLEPAKMLEPLFTILLAIIFSFFAVELYDRNYNVIIPALIAGSALIFSHIKKHHLEFNKYFIAAIIGAFFFASELVTTRLILNYYSPFTFYFMRCASIFLISIIAFRPNFSKLGKKSALYVLITGFVWVAYRTIVYYGYLTLGVIFTTLIIMLGPVFVYLFARIFLKEKIDKRNIWASVVIIACVLYAILV